MPRLPVDAFAEVFEPLQGKRIGFVRTIGNVGDRLIEWATFQLFDAYGIDWRICDPAGPVEADIDELVFGGGGNMGTRYRNNWQLRCQVLKLGRPVTIFPQSFTSREDRPYKRVYVRETGSLRYCRQATLAPDLALGLNYDTRLAPTRRMGVFLRRDRERAVRRRWFARDPAKLCRTPREYLQLAAKYEQIVTDRLHFAICGLLVGRDTTLLPNAYHKNRSMYETWLKDLGCRFAPSLKEALSAGRADTLPARGARDSDRKPAVGSDHRVSHRKQGFGTSMAATIPLRPRVTLEEIFGPGHVFTPRPSFSRYGWLPDDVVVQDAMTGGTLTVIGNLPIICSRAVLSDAGVELLAAGGLPVTSNPTTYRTEAEYLDHLATAARDHRRIAVSHLHPKDEIPRDAYWIDPSLLSYLNNKANLAELTPTEAVPSRRLVPTAALRFLNRGSDRLPLVIKAASNLSSGGGLDVMVARKPDDLRRAEHYFARCEQVVVEEYLTIERNLCVNYATVGSTIAYLGTAEQVTTPRGGYLGNWLTRRQDAPAVAVQLGREIMRRAASLGYRGVGGFDMGVLPNGRVVVFDLNFRINGCTASLLLQEAVFEAYGTAEVARLRAWHGAGSLADLCAVARCAVRDRYLVPLSTYDPAVGPSWPRAKPRLTGLLLGTSREEVAAKQQYLEAQGLVGAKSVADTQSPQSDPGRQKVA